MSDNNAKTSEEFIEIIKNIRENAGKRILSADELLFITADEISRSYTMSERKITREGDASSS